MSPTEGDAWAVKLIRCGKCAAWDHLRRKTAMKKHNHSGDDRLIQFRGRRSAIVEHPFGTICRADYRHFLVRGFDKVRGEWSLMALCYNFTRVLNIRLRALRGGHGKGVHIPSMRSRRCYETPQARSKDALQPIWQQIVASRPQPLWLG